MLQIFKSVYQLSYINDRVMKCSAIIWTQTEQRCLCPILNRDTINRPIVALYNPEQRHYIEYNCVSD